MQAIDDEQMLAVLSPRIALLTWLQARPEARCRLQSCVIWAARQPAGGLPALAVHSGLLMHSYAGRYCWPGLPGWMGGGLLKKQVFTGFTPGFR